MTGPDNWWLLAAAACLTVVWARSTTRHRLWRRADTWRRGSVLALVAVLAAQVPLAGTDDVATAATDVVLVIDRTTSMGALDFDGDRPRMAGVAEDVAAVVAALPGARIGVVTVDNEARQEVPWTTDGAAVETFARTIGWREAGLGNGSTIDGGLALASEMFQRARAERPEARRLLVYFGDGEQTGNAPPQPVPKLAGLLDDALVLGYGTTTGAVMASSPTDAELVRFDGEPAVSRLDPDALRALADELGGRFVHRPSPRALDFWRPDPHSPTSGDLPQRPATTWVAAGLLAGLVGWELWAATLTHLRARREVLP